MGPALEAHALRRALDVAATLPASEYLSVNISATCLPTSAVNDVLQTADPSQIVIELTEHDHGDPELLLPALAGLRQRGFRIAMDDMGAGYAGLHRVLTLSPDVIKLDRTLVCHIDVDPAKAALVSATVTFAAHLDATLIAEGVETPEEAATCAALGVAFAQGYHFGRPAPLPPATTLDLAH